MTWAAILGAAAGWIVFVYLFAWLLWRLLKLAPWIAALAGTGLALLLWALIESVQAEHVPLYAVSGMFSYLALRKAQVRRVAVDVERKADMNRPPGP